MSDDSRGEMPRRTFVSAVAAGMALPWPAAPGRPADAAPAPGGPLHDLPAHVLADLIRRRQVSSLEAVDACLARIAQVNPKLNAVVQLRAEDARAEARKCDAELARGKRRGPLHGLPFTAKDSFEAAGIISTAGTQGWATRVPATDATIVGRLRGAGAILLGKTNTPEFTWSDETDNLVYGRTNNPYDLSRTPGGSSGGPAAILATGGSPLDIGSDTGNSIRMPGHNCGVAGIKPTHGRVPKTGHAVDFRGIMESWTQVGPMARTVDDLIFTLPIVSGPDMVDPYAMPVPLGDPTRVTIRGLRVVTFTANKFRVPTPETVQTVAAAAKALEAAGAHVEEREPPGLGEATELWRAIANADGGAWLGRLLAAAGTKGTGSLPPLPVEKQVPSDKLSALVEQLDDVRSRLLRFMQQVDVIVCPAMGMPAVPHGGSNQPGYADGYNEPHNITGFPAAVVRGGTSPEGLPIGVQVVGRPWREDVVLAAAKVIETRLGGWRPSPLFA